MAYAVFVKTQDEPVSLVVKSGAVVHAGDPIGYDSGWVVANAYSVATTPIKAQFISMESCVGDGTKTIKAVRRCVIVDQDAPFTAGGKAYLYGVATVTPGSMITQTATNGAGYLLGYAASTSELAIDIPAGGANVDLAASPYEVDAAQRFPLGTKAVLDDGRTYRYGKASGTCYPQLGAYKAKKTNTVAVAPVQAAGAGDAGDSAVTVTIDTEIGVLTTGVLSINELAGGYVVIGNGSAQNPQMRRIVSHAALATTGGSLTLVLDSPLFSAVTAATTTIELMENPFYNLKADGSGGEYVSVVGIPSVLGADGEFLWFQTKGPCWLTSNSNTCDSAMDRTVVFVGNQSVVSSNDVVVESGLQVAGYALDMSGSSSSNAPFVMLQLE